MLPYTTASCTKLVFRIPVLNAFVAHVLLSVVVVGVDSELVVELSVVGPSVVEVSVDDETDSVVLSVVLPVVLSVVISVVDDSVVEEVVGETVPPLQATGNVDGQEGSFG